MSQKSIIFTGLTILVLVGAAVGIYVLNNDSESMDKSKAYAKQIPQDTYFDQVKILSEGIMQKCLSQSDDTKGVADKDGQLDYMKSFGSVIGSVIPDMPAGKYENYVNTAKDTYVTGSIVFADTNQVAKAGSLNSFNYAVSRSDSTQAWKLSSFIACNPANSSK